MEEVAPLDLNLALDIMDRREQALWFAVRAYLDLNQIAEDAEASRVCRHAISRVVIWVDSPTSKNKMKALWATDVATKLRSFRYPPDGRLIKADGVLLGLCSYAGTAIERGIERVFRDLMPLDHQLALYILGHSTASFKLGDVGNGFGLFTSLRQDAWYWRRR